MKNEFYNINDLIKVETETSYTDYPLFEKVLDVYLTFWNYITFKKGKKKAYYYKLYINEFKEIIGDTLEEVIEEVKALPYCNDRFAIVNNKIMLKPYVKLFFSNNSIAIRFFDTEEDVKKYVKYIIALKPSLQIELFSSVKV